MRPYFVRVGQRWQHLWVAGSGAPLLLIHSSPNRALTLRPLIEHLANSYLVIAPDNPGNGYSDPLPAYASQTKDYAAAALALMDALHVDRFAVYGQHSGAVIAAELACAAPARVCGVVCEGYPLWTTEEVTELGQEFLGQFPPEPSGAHLAKLWSFLIDQSLYFPSYQRKASHSVKIDLNDDQRLHAGACALLDTGANYEPTMRIALKEDGEARLQALSSTQTPALLLTDVSDVLANHHPRYPTLKKLTPSRCDGLEDRRRQLQAFFDLCQVPLQSEGLYLPEAERRYVRPRAASLGADEWIYVEVPRNATSVWLHDLGESHRRGPTSNVRMDLPGHGYSTAPWPGSREAAVALVAETLETLGRRPADATGRGLGRQIAEAFAGTTPSKRPTSAMPDLTPSWEGAHLLRAWHYCRYRSQYPQWQQRSSDQRRAADMPSAEVLQQQTIDLLRAGADTLNAVSAEDAALT